MENVKCTKYGCKSTSFRQMADNGSTVTLKCNICGTMFKAPKTKTSTASSGQGRSVYGDRPSGSTTSNYASYYSKDEDRSSSDYSSSSSDSSGSSSSNDSFGGGSSDGGGCSNDF